MSGSVRVSTPVRVLLTLGVLVALGAPPVPASGSPSRDATTAALRETLDAQRHRFCSDENYRMFQEDKETICPHQAELVIDCPGVTHACRVASWEEYSAEEEDASSSAGLLARLAPFLAPVLDVAFWLALALGTLAILKTLVGTLRTRAIETREEESELPKDVRPLGRSVNLSARELLEDAERMLASGQPRAALHRAYGAALRALAEGGWLATERSRTTGEYLDRLRKLDPRSDRAAACGLLLLDLDRARFSSLPEDEQTQGLMARVRTLVQSASGPLTLLLALVLPGCGPEALPEAPGQPTGPQGFSLAQALIEDRAESTELRMRRVTDVSPQTTAVVSLGANLRKLEWSHLEQYVTEGGHLVVVGFPAELGEAFGVELELVPCAEPPALDGLVLRPLRLLVGFAKPASAIELAPCGETSFAAAYFHGRGVLTVIADPTFFHNASLIAADNAAFALSLLGDLDGHVEILGPLTGKGSLHPLESLSRSGLLPWLLHLLALLLVFIWVKGPAFGRRTSPPLLRPRSFRLHAEALASTYKKKKALTHSLRQYAELTSHVLLRRSEGGQDRSQSLSSGVTHHAQEAEALRRAMTLAKNADQLGMSEREIMDQFRELTNVNRRMLARLDHRARTGATPEDRRSRGSAPNQPNQEDAT